MCINLIGSLYNKGAYLFSKVTYSFSKEAYSFNNGPYSCSREAYVSSEEVFLSNNDYIAQTGLRNGAPFPAAFFESANKRLIKNSIRFFGLSISSLRTLEFIHKAYSFDKEAYSFNKETY